MSDTRETLRRGVGDFTPRPDAYRRFLERRDRKARNRRLGAFSVVAMIALAGALAVVHLRSGPAALDDGPRPSGLPSNGVVVFAATHLEVGPPGPDMGDMGIHRKDPRDLYITTPGGEPRRIAGSEGDGVDQGCPAFSPDGTRLAYVEGVNRFESTSVLLLNVGADGAPSGSPVEILANVTGCPQWSPAGDRLAIAGHGEVRIFGLDGSSSTVPTDGLIDPPLAWSPDGAVLAITNLRSGVLQIVPVDGGEPAVIWTADRGQEASAIAWSPDGAQLAVSGVHHLTDPSSCCYGDAPFLEMVDVRDGSRTPVQVEGDPSGDTAEGIAWPSDDRIVVSFFRGATDLVDPTGATPTRSADLSLGEASIPTVVSPDREWLLYVAYDGDGAYAIVAEPVDGGPPVFYSPWSLGLYSNYEDFAWQPIPR